MIATSFEDSTSTAGVTYYGDSLKPAALSTDACWSITAYTTATKKWTMANGTVARNLKWSDRLAYTYI